MYSICMIVKKNPTERDDQDFSLDDAEESSSQEDLTPPTAKLFKHSDPLDDAIFTKRQGMPR